MLEDPLHKYKLDVLLAEYKAIGDEITRRVGSQNQVLSLSFAIIGGLGAIASGVFKGDVSDYVVMWVLLGLPFFSSGAGLTILNQDWAILGLQAYAEQCLPDNLRAIAGQAPEFPEFRRRYYAPNRFSNIFGGAITKPFPHGMYLVISAAALVLLLTGFSVQIGTLNDLHNNLIGQIIVADIALSSLYLFAVLAYWYRAIELFGNRITRTGSPGRKN